MTGRPRNEAQACAEHLHRALGIDPGLAATGYAVVGTLHSGGELCDCGVVKTSSRCAVPERLQAIYCGIENLLLRWRPELIVIEDVYMLDRFPKAAIQLGEVRGVIGLAAQNSSLPVMLVKPTEVKSILTGNGRAAKDHVNRAVKRMLGRREDIRPDHASDAAALALIGLTRSGYFNF